MRARKREAVTCGLGSNEASRISATGIVGCLLSEDDRQHDRLNVYVAIVTPLRAGPGLRLACRFAAALMVSLRFVIVCVTRVASSYGATLKQCMKTLSA